MRLGLILLGVLALAAGCVKPKPAGPPVLVEQLQVEPRIYWSAPLNDRLVSIDGYIGFDNGENGQAVAIGQRLFTQPNGGGQMLIRFDLERGDGPNQLKLAEARRETTPGFPNAPATITFDMARTTVQDAAGKPHPLNERVRITGRLTYQAVANAGLMWDEDGRSPTGRRFKPMLEDVVIETAPAG